MFYIYVCIFPNNHFFQAIYQIIYFLSHCSVVAPFCWLTCHKSLVYFMNMACSVISLILTLGCSILCSLTWHKPVSTVLMLLLAFLSVSFVYFGILASRFISRVSLSVSCHWFLCLFCLVTQRLPFPGPCPVRSYRAARAPALV